MEALTIEELKHFNSRPHGGRPRTLQSTIKNLVISTHALTEGDNEEEACHLGQSISTHALTEGDAKFVLYSCDKGISTHALTEGDIPGYTDISTIQHFNSRPHGGRRA